MNDSLIDALAAIWTYQKNRPCVIDAGIQALHRLIPAALSRTPTGKIIGRFLLGLYDGATYRFDLRHLHRLSLREFEDCLRVLEMDYMPEVEVHQRVDEGDSVWRELAELWRAQPLELIGRLPLALRVPELCAKRRQAIQAQGTKAFDRLLQVAERRTGQSRIVGVFLMSLTQHARYRFNLTDLRGLDIKLFEDCLRVIRMDYLTDTEAA